MCVPSRAMIVEQKTLFISSIYQLLEKVCFGLPSCVHTPINRIRQCSHAWTRHASGSLHFFTFLSTAFRQYSHRWTRCASGSLDLFTLPSIAFRQCTHCWPRQTSEAMAFDLCTNCSCLLVALPPSIELFLLHTRWYGWYGWIWLAQWETYKW